MEDVIVIISMMVMCNAIVIIEYDRRLWLPNATIVMEHDYKITEESLYNHNPCIINPRT